MALRKQPLALWIACTATLGSVTTWFVLNHFRVQFYNSAMEGPGSETSPYWTIIRIQDVLQYLIYFLAACTAVLILIEFIRFITSRIRR